MSDQEDLGGVISASEDEDDVDVRRHAKLIDAISSLDGKKRVKLSERTVPVQQVSEFTFTSGEKKKVALHELVGSLKETASHGELKKQLRSVQKNKRVSVPLPTQEKQKIERAVAYEKTSKDVSKWDPIVKENRKAEQIIYPLERSTISVHTTDSFVKRFQPRTPLEMEVAAVLAGSQNVPLKNKELTPAEEKAIKAMSLEEAKERRAELMKYRALLSYKEAKARWQGKIKSKKYHRILKKEKLKKEKRALEELEKNDPEGYQQKMEGVEKQRIQERMSLKHRGGSKFARKQMMYSKYDEQARQQVQDMLQKSRELTEKQRVVSDSDDDEEDGVAMDPEDEEVMDAMGDNPWMETGSGKNSQYSCPQVQVGTEDQNEGSDNDKEGEGGVEDTRVTNLRNGEDSANQKLVLGNLKTVKADEDSEEEVTIEEIFKPLDEEKLKRTFSEEKDSQAEGERRKRRRRRKKKTKVNQEVKNESDVVSRKRKLETKDNEVKDDDEDEEEEDLIDEGLTRVKTLEDIESKRQSDDAETTIVKKKRKNKKKGEKDSQNVGKDDVPDKVEEVYVDPKKLFTVETKMKSAIPDMTGHDDDDDDDDDDDQQRMTIAQAFEDDDVIEEFKEGKKMIMDRDKPKDIDLTLPGWGNWGGTGIKPKKKNKRFIIKAPPALPRKDKSLGNVIISELKDKAISKYQVSDLPFPYGDVKQFEQSIRAPVGKTWNPETAFKQLIKPKVVTKLGQVINPIDKDEVFKKQKVTNQLPENAQKEQSKGHGKKRRKR